MSYLHKYVVVPADKTLNNTGYIYMYTGITLHRLFDN